MAEYLFSLLNGCFALTVNLFLTPEVSVEEYIPSTARSIELPPVIFPSESNSALLFRQILFIIKSLSTDFEFIIFSHNPFTIVFGVITPVVRVPVLSVQIRFTYASSGIFPGFLARILNFSIVLTFCFVTSLIISGNPSGTAATMIVNAFAKFCAIFCTISRISPEKYEPKPPTFIIPDTVMTIKARTAAIVPHLEIKSHRLSIAISRAVFGASSVCILTSVSPLTVFTPTSVINILPSPETTVVPEKRQF